MTRTLALFLALTLAAPAFALDAAAVVVAVDAQAAKHYDPAHPGHSHQCNRCGATYHQQGDMGPYSPGSNICPRCGFANPIPPSPPQPNPYPPAPYPNHDMTWTVGRDGVRVDYPSRGWTWTEGRDGRRVVYPAIGWTWTEGRDGRRVPYPLSGWTWTEGRDGFRVVYPILGWNWAEGRDGRRVPYPINGWNWYENSYGRVMPFPYGYGYAGQDYTAFLIQAKSQALSLRPEDEPYRDLLLRQMRILEY